MPFSSMRDLASQAASYAEVPNADVHQDGPKVVNHFLEQHGYTAVIPQATDDLAAPLDDADESVGMDIDAPEQIVQQEQQGYDHDLSQAASPPLQDAGPSSPPHRPTQLCGPWPAKADDPVSPTNDIDVSAEMMQEDSVAWEQLKEGQPSTRAAEAHQPGEASEARDEAEAEAEDQDDHKDEDETAGKKGQNKLSVKRASSIAFHDLMRRGYITKDDTIFLLARNDKQVVATIKYTGVYHTKGQLTEWTVHAPGYTKIDGEKITGKGPKDLKAKLESTGLPIILSNWSDFKVHRTLSNGVKRVDTIVGLKEEFTKPP